MQPQLLVQSLQGTRAQILLAFLFAGHAMDVEELRTWTGKDRKTHYGHLAALCVTGLLAKQTQAHGREVYLLGSEMLPALQAWVAQIGSGAPALAGGAPLLQESGIRTPAEVVVVDDSLFKSVPTITTITTTSGQMSGNRTSDEYAALAAACNRHKIIGTKRRALIEDEWVTAERVDAAVKQAIDERSWDNPVGMAINRLLDHIEAAQPVDVERREYKRVTVGKGKQAETLVYTFDIDQEAADFTGHRKGCTCLDCAVYRLRGEGGLCPDCKHFNCECEEAG